MKSVRKHNGWIEGWIDRAQIKGADDWHFMLDYMTCKIILQICGIRTEGKSHSNLLH